VQAWLPVKYELNWTSQLRGSNFSFIDTAFKFVFQLTDWLSCLRLFITVFVSPWNTFTLMLSHAWTCACTRAHTLWCYKVT
jgi:hypothetical protein